MEKDRRIVEVLKWLKEWLGDSINIVDIAEADLSAIRIASPRHSPQQQVYISVWGTPADLYNVDLEAPPILGSVQPYETIGKFR